MNEPIVKLTQSEFLQMYSITKGDYDRTGFPWEMLEEIYALHSSSIKELQATGDYVASRLSALPYVHSLKVRVKHPEHLVEKIIRKKLERPKLKLTEKNYRTHITDLVGIRALHLFKDYWQPIHEFVKSIWTLHEEPIAYVRKGDSEAVQNLFRASGCRVRSHKFGYRSVHYLIQSQPTKEVQLAEIQVRTLFEEGWSEIDHQIRYPRHSSDPQLADFLTIFNRLAGSADEMGTFIKNLSATVSQQAAESKAAEARTKTIEEELKKAISLLAISKREKKKLEDQLSELQKSIQPRGVAIVSQPLSALFGSHPGGASLSPSAIGDQPVSALFGSHPGGASLSPSAIGSQPVSALFGNHAGGAISLSQTAPTVMARTCDNCGQIFSDSLSMTNNKCPRCRLNTSFLR